MITSTPPARIQKLMKGLPTNRRVRAHLSAWELSSELRTEIQDYFDIFRSSEEVSQKLNLHRWIISDVLLLGALLRIPDFQPPFKTVCSAKRIEEILARCPGDVARKEYGGRDFDLDTKLAFVNDFYHCGSVRKVGKRFGIRSWTINNIVLCMAYQEANTTVFSKHRFLVMP